MKTHLDLFSGVGGFALAARWNGLKTIAFSEIDPYACKILEKNFPGVPNLGDIRKVQGIRADLLTAGIPCQTASCAGKRRGSQDDRWLWPEALRVLVASRPNWAIFENVPGLMSLEQGFLFETLLFALEDHGYSVQTLIIPACAVGAGHRRNRVWIIAHLDGAGLEVGKEQPARQECEAAVGGDRPASDIACVRNGKNQPEQKANQTPVGNLSGGHCWAPEVDGGLLRTVYGLPAELDRRKRIGLLGNSIVPLLAYHLISFILRTEELLCREKAKSS